MGKLTIRKLINYCKRTGNKKFRVVITDIAKIEVDSHLCKEGEKKEKVGKMNLSEIYYYCVSIAMIAGVQIASALNLNIDQNSDGRLSISFHASDSIKVNKK